MSTLRAAIAGTALLASPAFAHHSPAPYDMSVQQTVEGVITEVAWKNPHVYLTLETVGADGAAALQEIEAVGVSGMASEGLSQDDFVIGDRVSVLVNPSRRGAGHEALGLALTTSAGVVLALRSGVIAPPAPTAEAEGLAGNWLTDGPAFQALAASSQTWPLTEEGARVAADVALRNAVAASCSTFGPPALMMMPGLTVIDVSDDTIGFEVDNGGPTHRVVHLDVAEAPAGTELTAEGYSIGRWEDGVLVVETTLFAEDPEGLGFGLPSGVDKRVTERFTPGEDRRSLTYEATLVDPAYLREPMIMTGVWTYHPELEPSRLACDPDNATAFLEQ